MRGTPSTSATMFTREGRLQRRVLEEVVEHDVGVGVALELDDEAGACSPADSSLMSAMPSISPAVDQLLDLAGDRREADVWYGTR